MEFISNFWAAYVPVGIVFVVAVIEWVGDARKGWTRRPSLDEREHARASAVVFHLAWPRSPSAPRRTTLPAGAVPGRVISLQEARRRRSQAPGESRMRCGRA
jgi:hypothetical protein